MAAGDTGIIAWPVDSDLPVAVERAVRAEAVGI
jgi:hypothetical protein